LVGLGGVCRFNENKQVTRAKRRNGIIVITGYLEAIRSLVKDQVEHVVEGARVRVE